MPRGNGTGPMGLGPMTGRAAGFCAEYPAPGYMNFSPGGGSRGWGRGFFGRGGWRRRAYTAEIPGWPFPGAGPIPSPEITTEQELAQLKQQTSFIQENLSRINERIQQLEQETQ